MAQLVRQAACDAHLALSGHCDKIIVQNLNVVVNAGTDVWGRKKKQRAAVSLVVTLAQQFASASATDTVDQSTIHYGTLSKAVQACLEDDGSQWLSTAQLSAAILQSVRQVAGQTPLFAIQTDVCYPKGTMFGQGVSHITSHLNLEQGQVQSTTLHLRDVQIPCLIGVNSNERLKKQPVIANLWVDCLSDARLDDYAELETVLVNLVSETTYQTIESLLAHVVQRLQQDFFSQDKDKGAWVRLRVEKPLAVPFASAPAVEITRELFV